MTTAIYVWINLLLFLVVTSKKSFPLVSFESDTTPIVFVHNTARRKVSKEQADGLKGLALLSHLALLSQLGSD